MKLCNKPNGQIDIAICWQYFNSLKRKNRDAETADKLASYFKSSLVKENEVVEGDTHKICGRLFQLKVPDVCIVRNGQMVARTVNTDHLLCPKAASVVLGHGRYTIEHDIVERLTAGGDYLGLPPSPLSRGEWKSLQQKKTRRQYIIHFLQNLPMRTTKKWRILEGFFRKSQVYKVYCQQAPDYYVSKQWFYKVWSETPDTRTIRVMLDHGKCPTCLKLLNDPPKLNEHFRLWGAYHQEAKRQYTLTSVANKKLVINLDFMKTLELPLVSNRRAPGDWWSHFKLPVHLAGYAYYWKGADHCIYFPIVLRSESANSVISTLVQAVLKSPVNDVDELVLISDAHSTQRCYTVLNWMEWSVKYAKTWKRVTWIFTYPNHPLMNIETLHHAAKCIMKKANEVIGGPFALAEALQAHDRLRCFYTPIYDWKSFLTRLSLPGKTVFRISSKHMVSVSQEGWKTIDVVKQTTDIWRLTDGSTFWFLREPLAGAASHPQELQAPLVPANQRSKLKAMLAALQKFAKLTEEDKEWWNAIVEHGHVNLPHSFREPPAASPPPAVATAPPSPIPPPHSPIRASTSTVDDEGSQAAHTKSQPDSRRHDVYFGSQQ